MSLLEPSNNFSFTLFLNLVLKWFTHFEEDICWVHKANVSNAYHLPMQFNNTDYAYNQQVVNPPDCVPGCHYYILHDPISNHLEEYINNCINTTYQFKGVVFQTQDRLDDYNMSMVFAHYSIFVSTVSDTLVIEKFTDWQLTRTRVLNVWSVSNNAFAHPVHLERYFSEKTHNNAKAFSEAANRMPTTALHKPTVTGIHIHILKEFARKINLGLDVFPHSPANASKYLAWFNPGTFGGTFLSTIINRNRIGFIVPKKRIRINMTNIIEVFQWELWMCTFVLYFTICAYLIGEKYLEKRPIERINFPIKLFCMQPLSTREIADNRRVKFVLSLLFFFVSSLSILFNYGVLNSLLKPKYENDIRTWDDLHRANLPIYWHRDPLWLYTYDNATVKDVLARWTKDESILEDRQKSIQMHCITDVGLSTLLLEHYDLPNAHVTSVDDLYGIVHYHIEVSYFMLPRMRDLNKLIRLSQETGLTAKWEWEAYLLTTNVFGILAYLDKRSAPETTAKLTMDHLLGVFCGLLIGLLLATIVFFIECYIKAKLHVQ